MPDTNQLVVLYQRMYDHTKDECASHCRAPHSCCALEYCEMTAEFAKAQGVILTPVAGARLPFLSPTGCIVPPHLRPICTVHTCDINGLGYKRDDKDGAWTKKYFEIRDEIDRLDDREY